MTDNVTCSATHDDHIDAACQLLQMDLHFSDNTEMTREDYQEALDYVPDDITQLLGEPNG